QRRRSAEYLVVLSNRTTARTVRRTSRSLKRASSPDRRLGIVSRSITRSIRGTQIPIVRDEPPSSRFPRFPPLEVFRRRPAVRAAPSVSGRYPKTFTLADSRSIFLLPDR